MIPITDCLIPGHTSASFSTGEKEKLLTRTKSLGIHRLFNENFDYDGQLTLTQIQDGIETALWKKGEKIKTPLLHASKGDVKIAIDFLELFCSYAQFTKLPEASKEKVDQWMGESILRLEYALHRATVKKGEKIAKTTVKQAISKIEKLLENLPLTAQQALVDKVRTAERILKRYFK